MSKNSKPSSVKDLGKRIEQAKKKSLESDVEVAPVGAMHIGVDLLAGVLVGAFVGYQLDKWLGTLPIFFLICFFLGVAGAIRNILRTIKNTNSLDKNALDDNKTDEK